MVIIRNLNLIGGQSWTYLNCDDLLVNPMKFKTSTTLGNRSFAVAAPQLWNSLPYAIRSSSLVASFKKSLKTLLFEKAFW